jgi:hypothetical protein
VRARLLKAAAVRIAGKAGVAAVVLELGHLVQGVVGRAAQEAARAA